MILWIWAALPLSIPLKFKNHRYFQRENIFWKAKIAYKESPIQTEYIQKNPISKINKICLYTHTSGYSKDAQSEEMNCHPNVQTMPNQIITQFIFFETLALYGAENTQTCGDVRATS